MASSPAADGAVAPAATQWVVFACGPQWFGLPLDHSREILPPRPLTRLPGCGPQVGGLVGIRGHVHTVFDFGIILRNQSSLRSAGHRLLVLAIPDRCVAVAVDEVIAVSRDAVTIAPLSGDTRPEHIAADDVVGVGDLEGRSFLALDPDRILSRLFT